MFWTTDIGRMQGLFPRSLVGMAGALVFLALIVSTAGASRSSSPALTETIVSPTAGATISGSVVWAVQLSGGPAKRLDFAVDGKLASRLSVPGDLAGVRVYRYGGVNGFLDTGKLRDGAHRLKVTTYARNGSRVSAAVTVTVANQSGPASVAPTPVSPPVVGGDALVGRTLSSTDGQWAGSAPMTFSFVWLRCRPDCVPIDGAGSSTYTLTDADLGATVRSQVTASNAAGSAAESSAATGVVTAAASGKTLILNEWWGCRTAVDYDLVRVTVTSDGNAVDLFAGCTGRIGRLEIIQHGSGDGMKIQPFGAHDLTIGGGFVYCDSPPGANHIDGMQAGGGDRVTFIGVRFFCGVHTSSGSGGNSQFYLDGWNGDHAKDVVCIGCTFGPNLSSTLYIGVNSERSGARNSIVCQGVYFDIRSESTSPVNSGNVVVPVSDPRCQLS
jgi:hypothetical protein